MAINAVLFDMDGVLVDACEWHREALNEALIIHDHKPISIEDHYKTYNGLPTKRKLRLLGIDEREIDIIEKNKQRITMEIVNERCLPNTKIIKTLEYLKSQSLKLGCVTNSVEFTTKQILAKSEILEYFDIVVTNNDVKRNKPFPDCYLFACEALNMSPKNVLVIEDNPKGIQSAIDAGCNVRVLFDIKDLTVDFIKSELRKY